MNTDDAAENNQESEKDEDTIRMVVLVMKVVGRIRMRRKMRMCFCLVCLFFDEWFLNLPE